MALLTNLFAYYPLDGNGNDATAGARNATATTVTFSSAFGIINQGVGGTSGTLVAGSTVVPSSFNTGLSISAWAKPANNTTNFTNAIDIAGGSFGDVGIAFGGALGIGYFFGTGSANNQHNTGGAYSAGAWVHVVITHNGTTEKIYVNGVLKSTDTGGTLGGNGSAGFFIFNQFNGDIDEVGLWTRELTLTDVTQLYNSGAGLAYPFSAGSPVVHSLSSLGAGA
jgi:hypothetical protein